MAKNWWELGKFPDLSMAKFDPDWISQALAHGVINETIQGPLYDNGIAGVIKGATFDEVLAKIKSLGFRVVASSPSWRDEGGDHAVFINGSGGGHLFQYNDELSARLVTNDKATFDAFRDILIEHTGQRVSSGKAFVLVMGRDKPVLKSIGLASSKLEEGNYNPDVVEDYKHVVEDLKSSDPTGRLTILDGPPGCGKTYAIRGFMDSVPDALFIFLPVSLIPHLASPSMIGTLIDTKSGTDAPMVFIVEDADTTLARRGVDNLESISALLNLGDGILGSMLDIRVICTTNLKDAEMDEAVIRPGRLNRKIHVNKLDPKVAEQVYTRLTGNKIKIDERLTLAQVYSLAKDKGWVAPVKAKKSVGFSTGFTASSIINSLDD